MLPSTSTWMWPHPVLVAPPGHVPGAIRVKFVTVKAMFTVFIDPAVVTARDASPAVVMVRVGAPASLPPLLLEPPLLLPEPLLLPLPDPLLLEVPAPLLLEVPPLLLALPSSGVPPPPPLLLLLHARARGANANAKVRKR